MTEHDLTKEIIAFIEKAKGNIRTEAEIVQEFVTYEKLGRVTVMNILFDLTNPKDVYCKVFYKDGKYSTNAIES